MVFLLIAHIAHGKNAHRTRTGDKLLIGRVCGSAGFHDFRHLRFVDDRCRAVVGDFHAYAQVSSVASEAHKVKFHVCVFETLA